jgi:hypothetical protein
LNNPGKAHFGNDFRRAGSEANHASEMPDQKQPLKRRMTMKHILKTILISGIAGIATPVFAAAEGRTDDSHLLTYIFLSVCGLIIILQLVPVVSLVRDLLNKAAARQAEIDMKTATSKYR